MIKFHGKWCSTHAELKIAETLMLDLCAKADFYGARMDNLCKQMTARQKSQNSTEDQKQYALLDAEWAFAQACFTELSTQAAMVGRRVHELEDSAQMLVFRGSLLYSQIDTELRDGQLAPGIPHGE